MNRKIPVINLTDRFSQQESRSNEATLFIYTVLLLVKFTFALTGFLINALSGRTASIKV